MRRDSVFDREDMNRLKEMEETIRVVKSPQIQEAICIAKDPAVQQAHQMAESIGLRSAQLSVLAESMRICAETLLPNHVLSQCYNLTINFLILVSLFIRHTTRIIIH